MVRSNEKPKQDFALTPYRDTSRLDLLSSSVYSYNNIIECRIEKYFSLGTNYTDYRQPCVFFASGVMTSTASESVLFEF